MPPLRISLAEALGAALLIICGVGTAVFDADRAGVLGVALAFGLSLLAVTYLIGPISGRHVNPAITAAMVAVRKTDVRLLPAYLGGQGIGGLFGAGAADLVDRSGQGRLHRHGPRRHIHHCLRQRGRLRVQRLRRPLPRPLQPRRHHACGGRGQRRVRARRVRHHRPRHPVGHGSHGRHSTPTVNARPCRAADSGLRPREHCRA